MIPVRESDVRIIKKAGEVLGDSSQLNEEKLNRSFIFCKTGVKCLKVDQEDLKKFLLSMSLTEEYKQRLNFLLSSIPSLDKLSRINKDRICRSFRDQILPSGHIIFKEGEFIKNGYLIRRGEIELYSRRNLQLISQINKLKDERKLDQD
jgi:hypothetical protein